MVPQYGKVNKQSYSRLRSRHIVSVDYYWLSSAVRGFRAKESLAQNEFLALLRAIANQ